MSKLEELALAMVVGLIDEQIRANDARLERIRQERETLLEEATELVRRRRGLNEALMAHGAEPIPNPPPPEEPSFASRIGLEAFGTAETKRPSSASTTQFRASDVTRLLNEGKKTK